MKSQVLKAIVVDDEKPSREALANYIYEFCPQVEIIAECASAKMAFKSITQHNPQLVFLDIEMPRGNGFDLLKMFRAVPFKVIFVTAFSDYAIQAFRCAAADYLMKPVKVTELIEAVGKVQRELNQEDSYQVIRTLLNNLESPSGESGKLVIPDQKGFQVINMSDIIFCKADSYCTAFHLVDNAVICSSRNLKYYEELLPKSTFMRVHHSFLVNISQVAGYTNQGEILLKNSRACPLSTAYKAEFLKFFKKFR